MREKNEPNDFEKRFHECDAKFNTIFELTSVASKIIRSDLTIVKVNKAFCELLGYPPEEIEGTKILDHACEEYIAHWHRLQDELWSKQVPHFKLQACLYRKDQSVVWVDVTTILYNDQGETFGFTVLDDISGLKKHQESEKRLNVALKYSDTAVWELDLETHEVFRSPDHDQIFGYEQRQAHWTLESYYPHIDAQDLPAFKAAIQHIQTQGERNTQLISQANKGINRISLIIDDLLNAGKNYSDQLKFRKTTFNLYELAQEICEQYASSETQTVTLNGDKSLIIHADSERIGRVLTNLISNAVKYAPGSAEIKVELQDETAFVKVSVTDQGPGISKEKIPLLFNRYYQADDQQGQYSGLGLGLFICANSIRKHAGEIGLESIPEQGTTFWFTLPK